MGEKEEQEYQRMKEAYLAVRKSQGKANATLNELLATGTTQSAQLETKSNELASLHTQLLRLDGLYNELRRQNREHKTRRKELILEEQQKTEELCVQFQGAIDLLHRDIDNGHTARAVRLEENDRVREQFQNQIVQWKAQEKIREKEVQQRESVCLAIEARQAEEREKLEALLGTLTESLNEQHALQSKELALRQELVANHERNIRLQEDLSATTTSVAELKRRIQQLSDMRSSNAKTLRQLTKERLTLANEKVSLERDIKKIEDEAWKVDEQVQVVSRQQAALQGLCGVLQDDHEAFVALCKALVSAGMEPAAIGPALEALEPPSA